MGYGSCPLAFFFRSGYNGGAPVRRPHLLSIRSGFEMTIQYTPRGVCSRSFTIQVEDGLIQSVQVVGGCSGNLQGISMLLKGMTVEEAIRRMRRSLEELVIEGYPTNSALAHLIMHDGEFVRLGGEPAPAASAGAL